MNFVIPEIIREKKKILMVVAALVVLGAAGILLISRRQRGEIISPFSGKGQVEKGEKLILWDDEAGFTFEYPEGLYIDEHSEDMENYAHLEITSSKETEGKIVILVDDATTKTIDDWVEQEEEATMASIIDTTLGESAAKKLLFKDSGKILTAAIDPYEGFFLLELEPGEGEFWQRVYDQILKSFAFKPLSEEEQAILEESGGGEAGGNVVYEAEEIIE